jgi:hypothetical protein
MITTDSDIAQALGAETLRFAWLFRLPGASAGSQVRLTAHDRDITLGAEVFQSTGDVLSVPSLVRERDVKAHSVSLTLSANDTLYHDILAGRSMTGEPCDILLACLDADGAVIGGKAITLYKGSFDGWSYREGPRGDTISIRITGPWAKPSQTAGRLTSDANQQERYPGDAFFKFAHEKKDQLGWGGEG